MCAWSVHEITVYTFAMPRPTLIDAHCHLDFEVFDSDREQVLQRAADRNISDIIIPGTEKKFWPRITQLCSEHHQLHPCFGLHPYWLNTHNSQDLNDLDDYISRHRPVALGECGLDFRADQADRKTQLHFFDAQLEIAQTHALPVVIHAVKATTTVIERLKKHKGLNGMIHSFSGSPEQAEQLIDMDFMISIGGSITYPNAKKARNTVRQIPLCSLLLETDAPDQADSNHKQQRNEPAFLLDTLNSVAELREIDVDTVAEQTTKNAKTLFAI